MYLARPSVPWNHVRPPGSPSNLSKILPPRSVTFSPTLRPRKSFTRNTYGSPRKCCKQKTYAKVKSFRFNTYKEPGVGVALQLSTFLPFNVQTCNSFSVTSLAAPTLQPQSNHILTITMGEGGPQPSNGFLPRCRRPLAFSHPMYSICPEQGWDRVANRRSQFTIP
jgi:hypothetical protein